MSDDPKSAVVCYFLSRDGVKEITVADLLKADCETFKDSGITIEDEPTPADRSGE